MSLLKKHGHCHWHGTGLSTELESVSPVSPSWDHWVPATRFYQWGKGVPKRGRWLPQGHRENARGGSGLVSDTQASAPLLGLPMCVTRLRESLRLTAAFLGAMWTSEPSQTTFWERSSPLLTFLSRESRCTKQFLSLHIFWTKNGKNVGFSAQKMAGTKRWVLWTY